MVENKQSNIKAILDTDLEKLLKETKQYNAFVDGELQCAYCGTTITIDNLSSIIIDNILITKMMKQTYLSDIIH